MEFVIGVASDSSVLRTPVALVTCFITVEEIGNMGEVRFHIPQVLAQQH